jgi:hypothetical protein
MNKLFSSLKYIAIARGWVVSIPIAVVWLFIWIWPGLQVPAASGPNNAQTLYLLSSIAQAFAAILALVFTVSLIAFQLFANYSQRLYGRFFDGITVAYIAGFIIVIVFSLFLTITPEPVGVKICLSLASTCLFVLVPYILNLRIKLSSNSLLIDLQMKAIREFETNIEREPESILTINDIINRSITMKDYDTAIQGLRSLFKALFEMQQLDEKGKTDILDFRSDDTAERTMRIFVSNTGDPVIERAIIYNLRRLGKSGVVAESHASISTSTGYLYRVSGSAVENKNEDLGNLSLFYFSDIVNDWMKNNFKVKSGSVSAEDEIQFLLGEIRDIGKQSLDSKLDFLGRGAIAAASQIADTAIDQGFQQIAKFSLKLLTELGPSLAKQSSRDGEITCYWLAQTGAKSIIKSEKEITDEIITSIKSIEHVLGKEKTCNGLAIKKKYKGKDDNFNSAYDGFVEKYWEHDLERK